MLHETTIEIKTKQKISQMQKIKYKNKNTIAHLKFNFYYLLKKKKLNIL